MAEEHSHPPLRKGQNLEGLRDSNLAVLLSAIWENSPISRIELASLTGLAPSSVTRLIEMLSQSSLIVETGKAKSSGGRQAVLVSPNPDAGIIVSLELIGSQIRAGIFDAANHLLAEAEQPFSISDQNATREQIIRFTHQLLDGYKSGNQKLLGLGVSISGMVQTQTGVVDSFNLRLENFPLKDILQEEFHLPVYIENDASAAAIAEKYYGAGRGVNDLVYIMVSKGIGSGIIKDGKVYRGAAGSTGGEIGHVIVDRSGPICLCGRRGCLEAVAAKHALITNAQRILAHNRDPIIAGMIGSDLGSVTLNVLSRAAAQGSLIAGDIIGSAADQLAYAITMITTILDIRLVIVGGEVPQELGDIFYDGLETSFRKYHRMSQEIKIVPAKLEKDTLLKGISILALQETLRLHF